MAWTDERLDDAFKQLRAEIRELREVVHSESRELRAEMRALRTEVHGEIGELRSQVYRFGGAMLVAQFGMIAAILGLIARG